MQITVQQAHQQLAESGHVFAELFQRKSVSVEIYRPEGKDLQQPHDRDEIYIIVSGNGIFMSDGQQMPFGPGDFLFVPAGVEHRFETFSDDFATWVIFFE